MISDDDKAGPDDDQQTWNFDGDNEIQQAQPYMYPPAEHLVNYAGAQLGQCSDNFDLLQLPTTYDGLPTPQADNPEQSTLHSLNPTDLLGPAGPQYFGQPSFFYRNHEPDPYVQAGYPEPGPSISQSYAPGDSALPRPDNIAASTADLSTYTPQTLLSQQSVNGSLREQRIRRYDQFREGEQEHREPNSNHQHRLGGDKARRTANLRQPGQDEQNTAPIWQVGPIESSLANPEATNRVHFPYRPRRQAQFQIPVQRQTLEQRRVRQRRSSLPECGFQSDHRCTDSVDDRGVTRTRMSEKQYMCEKCGWFYYECKECDRCEDKGDKPYPCPKGCGKWFSRKSGAHRHAINDKHPPAVVETGAGSQPALPRADHPQQPMVSSSQPSVNVEHSIQAAPVVHRSLPEALDTPEYDWSSQSWWELDDFNSNGHAGPSTSRPLHTIDPQQLQYEYDQAEINEQILDEGISAAYPADEHIDRNDVESYQVQGRDTRREQQPQRSQRTPDAPGLSEKARGKRRRH